VWIGDLHPVSSQAELRIWIHFSNVLKMTLSLFLIPSELSNYTLSSKKKKHFNAKNHFLIVNDLNLSSKV